MPDNERTMWGVHAGKTGDADKLFLHRNVVAIGWPEMGDLGTITASREAFKERYAEVYPESTLGAVRGNAGQLYRFVHEIQAGDVAVYPSKRDRKVHIGEVTGGYRHDPGLDAVYPNVRPVRWLHDLPRTRFSQGALYEIGSGMSLFQVSKYADEFLAALEGAVAEPVPEAKDESVALVAEEIQQITVDFILKQLGQELKGHPFSDFIAHLLELMGYRTRVSPPGPDRGIDVIAHRDELGFEPPIIKVQVKSGEGNVGAPDVQALYGNIGNSEYGLFVTLGTFTNQARTFAQGKSNLRLIDGDELIDLILQHYHDFDSRYKGLIPLKRVYIPEALGEGEEA